jgi:hypothetical protein
MVKNDCQICHQEWLASLHIYLLGLKSLEGLGEMATTQRHISSIVTPGNYISGYCKPISLITS